MKHATRSKREAKDSQLTAEIRLLRLVWKDYRAEARRNVRRWRQV